MTPKTIAVAFIESSQVEALSHYAARLARHHDAHLVGLSVVQDPHYDPVVYSYLSAAVLTQLQSDQKRAFDAVKRRFEGALAAEDVRGEWRLLRSEGQSLPDRLLESVRGADLLVMPQPAIGTASIHEQIIRGAGRPVLVLPPDAKTTAFTSAVVGWSPTREATRAAFDAMLLLEPGAKVTLLHVGNERAQAAAEGSMNALAGALDRHEMKVTVTHRDAKGERIATVIEREALETGADFIASGAFGHSRAYDFVIGAVTRELLMEAKYPILFSK